MDMSHAINAIDETRWHQQITVDAILFFLGFGSVTVVYPQIIHSELSISHNPAVILPLPDF